MKRTTIALCTTLAAASASSTAAAAPSLQWDETYGGDIDDPISAVVQTSDGGYLLAGSSDSYPSGSKTAPHKGMNDYWVVKIAPDGTKQWDRSYGGTGDDQLASVLKTSDGGYLLGGTSNSPIGGDKSVDNYASSTDYWLVKIDANGAKQWDKVYGGTGDEFLRRLVVSSGYLYLVGQSSSAAGGNKTAPNKGFSDYWVVKTYITNGIKIWDRAFGGASYDNLPAAEATATGGLVLAGYSYSGAGLDKTGPNYGLCDYWVVAIDGNGNKSWDRTYGGDGEDVARDVAVASNGELYVLGDSYSGVTGNKGVTTHGAQDFWLLRLDASGNKLVEASHGGTDGEYATRLIASPSSLGTRYLLAGYSYSLPGGDKQSANKGIHDGWLVEVNGQTLAMNWDISLGGSEEDMIMDLTRTSDGYFVGLRSRSGVSGDKSDPAYGWNDYWAAKLH